MQRIRPHLSLHRVRKGYSFERTALINRMRGLLAEFGGRVRPSQQALKCALPSVFEDEGLPAPRISDHCLDGGAR